MTRLSCVQESERASDRIYATRIEDGREYYSTESAAEKTGDRRREVTNAWSRISRTSQRGRHFSSTDSPSFFFRGG